MINKAYHELTDEEKELWMWFMYEEELKIRKHERYVREHNNPFR